jgi:hypothetical protein
VGDVDLARVIGTCPDRDEAYLPQLSSTGAEASGKPRVTNTTLWNRETNSLNRSHKEQLGWSEAGSACDVAMGMREASRLLALLVEQGFDFREAQPDFSADSSNTGFGGILHVGSPKRLVVHPCRLRAALKMLD